MSLLPTDPKDRKYMLMGLRIAGDFGASIAVPVILFVLMGQWLDGKYEKTPLFTVIAFILAAVVSGKMIYKKAKQYGKEYSALDEKK
ncbi:AtpZ/AtpI family protein [Patescibacteria group bacterium]|nr:AtpZ/AtpI family protein [Patescibacteria group bacterium]